MNYMDYTCEERERERERGRERERKLESEREMERERDGDIWLIIFLPSTHHRSLLRKLQAHDIEPHEFGQVFIRTVCTLLHMYMYIHAHVHACTCTMWQS